MCGKLRQWNLHVNCLVNGTTFQNRLRFQAGLSSLWVSWKHALKQIGSFIRFSKSLESEKSFRCQFSGVTLKSPISSILSYISLQKGCTLVTSEIKISYLKDCVLYLYKTQSLRSEIYKPKMSHFLFINASSNFWTGYSVPEADLRPQQLLSWNSLLL